MINAIITVDAGGLLVWGVVMVLALVVYMIVEAGIQWYISYVTGEPKGEPFTYRTLGILYPGDMIVDSNKDSAIAICLFLLPGLASLTYHRPFIPMAIGLFLLITMALKGLFSLKRRLKDHESDKDAHS